MSLESPAAPPLSVPDFSQTLPLRHLTLRLFDTITTHRQPLDKVLQDSQGFHALNAQDRALTRMLLTTMIRRLGQIDDLIVKAMTSGQLPEQQALVDVLRLGVAQIVFMNVPDHAAVNLSVTQAEQMGLARQKGLVNAVLRRIAREGKNLTTRQDIPRLNIPPWMLKSWIAAWGTRTALEVGQASLNEAPLDLTLRDPETAPEWAEKLEGTVLLTGTLRLRGSQGLIENLPGFTEGAWWVQDAAAALPVRLMGTLTGKTVLDLCAAPGGKTAQLVAAGAIVTALDRNPARMKMLRANLDRLSMTPQVTMVTAEATDWTPEAPFDAVLLDAPCTATGTLRRNPDILLHRTPDDVRKMGTLQARLIDHALTCLKPGGQLLYCVCSLQPEEGEDQIAAALARHENIARHPITVDEIAGESGWLTPGGDLRLLPTFWEKKGGMDGFFAARLQKKSAS